MEDIDYSSVNSSDTVTYKKKLISEQSLFFWMAGLTSLLPFTTLISMDDFWKEKFRHDATNFYPFFSNGGGLIALIFYDNLNKLASFKTQLKIYPIIVGLTFPLLYCLGQFNKNKEEQSWWATKNIVFLVIIVLQCIVNTILQTSLTRYIFNFGDSEISSFNGGGALSGIIFAVIYIIVTLVLGNRKDDTNVLLFLGLLLLIVLFTFYVFSKYIRNYLDKKDDLTGEKDSLKEMVEHDERSSSKKEVFYKIIALFFCLILCYSITLACFPVLTLAVGNNWLGSNQNLNAAYISALFNLFDLIGRVSYKWVKMRDNIIVYIFSLSRLILVIGYILATDPKFTQDFLSSQWFGYSLLILLALSNGYFTSAAFALASSRCENKNKKTSGYLMMVSLFLGMVYGGLISATCLENKSVPA